jgi:hypothetical protein
MSSQRLGFFFLREGFSSLLLGQPFGYKTDKKAPFKKGPLATCASHVASRGPIFKNTDIDHM